MKSKAKTVLFVEDNPLVLKIYRTWLERAGYNVEVAGDGEVALEKLPSLKPALVILDMMLPKVNGAEVLRFIRGHSGLRQTPILILSNAYLDDHALKVVANSANKRLLKTQCTPAILVGAVGELIGDSSGEPATAAAPAADGDALRESRSGLLKDAPAEIAKIREHCLAYVKSGGGEPGVEHLDKLYQRVQFLCARSGLGECTKIAHLASALEAMLFEIIFKKLPPSPSGLQSIAQAVDCLGRLFQNGDTQSDGAAPAARVLVVDDDPVCNYVTVTAMKRAKLQAVSAQAPQAALEMAQKEHFDIVLLDIYMPELNGFEVCKRLRQLPGYQTTPVIFVTACGEFENRAQAVLSGGNDLIAKPISPLELALKTLMHLVEPREQSAAARPKPEVKPLPTAAPAASASALEEIEMNADRLFNKAESNGEEEDKKPVAPVPPVIQPPPRTEAKPAAAPREPEPKLRMAPTSRDGAPQFKSPPPQFRNAPPLVRNGAPPAKNGAPPAQNGAPPAKNGTPQVKIPAPAYLTMDPAPVRRAPQDLNHLNQETAMKNQTENVTPVDKLAQGVARIMFGEEQTSEIQQRLTRIALEHYNVPEILSQGPSGNGNAQQPFDRVVQEVARVFFGDTGLSDMHLRLTRIALERYEVPSMLGSPPEVNGRGGMRMHAEPSGITI